MSKNRNLHNAKKAKSDEFYTQLTDIEKELKHYKEHFKGKVVYCNCDDPRESMFFHYFSYNFEFLGLKKLIATSYRGGTTTLMERGDKKRGSRLEYEGERDGARVPNSENIKIELLGGDGDFRSEESIELLKEADIVVTNPPFSLFREFVAQLIEYDKKFLIIGNMNAITYKEIFPLIRENKMWYGFSIRSGDREFRVPDHYPLEASGVRVDEERNKFIRVKGVRWFTNLTHDKLNEELILGKKYTPEEYPKYDNYDAIEVSKTINIPMDYKGVMGVPISFLDKYCPEQFEIVGLTSSSKENAGEAFNGEGSTRAQLKGKYKYARLLIKHKNNSEEE